MQTVHADDVSKMGPNVISTVRNGTPRGDSVDNYISRPNDGYNRSDNAARKNGEVSIGNYKPGRFLD